MIKIDDKKIKNIILKELGANSEFDIFSPTHFPKNCFVNLTKQYIFIGNFYIFVYENNDNVKTIRFRCFNADFYFAHKNNKKHFEELSTDNNFVFDHNIKSEIDNFIKYSIEINNQYNISLNHGLILYGPPGTGKTVYLRYIKEHYENVSDIHNDASLMNSHSAFSAINSSRINLFDDVDLTRFEERHSSYNSLLSLMDDASSDFKIRIFTTNQSIASISSAFLRPGRITKFIKIDLPKPNIRKAILQQIPVKNIKRLVHETKDYNLAELQLLKIYLIMNNFNNVKALKLMSERCPEIHKRAGF